MRKWMQGLKGFRENVFPEKRSLFKTLATGQTPDAMMIACADSRVHPHLITQTQPGDLFVVRNAGNFVPPYGYGPCSEIAAVELAINEFKVADIIVCGHSNCGAIKLLLNPDSYRMMPAMKAWLTFAGDTVARTKEKYPDAEGNELMERAIEQNVLVQLENLRTHPIVQRKLAEGALELQGLIYRIETGEIELYDPQKEAFVIY